MWDIGQLSQQKDSPLEDSSLWVLVSEPGNFLGFDPFPWKVNSFTRNETQEQHSLLDTMFDYIFILDLQENINM